MPVKRTQASGHDKCSRAAFNRLADHHALHVTGGAIEAGQKTLQVVNEVCRTAESIGGTLGQCLQTNAFQLAGDGRIELSQWPGFAVNQLLHHRITRIPTKGKLAGQHLVHHHAETEDVATSVDKMRFTSRLFGAHVAWRADATTI